MILPRFCVSTRNAIKGLVYWIRQTNCYCNVSSGIGKGDEGGWKRKTEIVLKELLHKYGSH